MASLSLLIMIIMVFGSKCLNIYNILNIYIVRQRAEEFASYMLPGMEKDKSARAFMGELSVIGAFVVFWG